MKSTKITNLSFMLALGIVWRHSMLPYVPENTPWQGLLLGMHYTNIMMDTIVPTFFFISGYLFFRTYTPSAYMDKLRSRVRSLLVPYLLWNAIFAAVWYAVVRYAPQYVSDTFPYGSAMEIVSGILMSHYTILWYLGVIFVYALIAPLLWMMIRDKRTFCICLLIACVVCIVFRHPFCSPALWLPIYMTGGYIGVHHKDFFFRSQSVYITMPALIALPLALYWDTFWHSNLSMNIVQWLGPAFCIGLYDVINRLIRIPTLSFFKYSFFLYAMHYMPLHVAERFCLSEWKHPLVPYLTYFFVPVLVVVLVMLVARLTDRYANPLYRLLSGGR